MAEQLPQFQDTEPQLEGQKVSSKASGYESFAKVLGALSGAAAAKAEDFAQEASQTQLLQQQGMLNDLERNSKIEMYKNPGMAVQIADRAAYTADTIKQTASLNRADRVKFNYLAENTVGDLKLQAVKATVDLNNEKVKYTALSTFNSTSQQIYEKLFTDPKAADILINAQYNSISGLVGTGILTANEGNVLHKQIEEEIKRAQIRGALYKSGEADATHANTINSFQPSPTPFSNANLPMTGDSRYQSMSYLNHMSVQDIKSAYASGQNVPATALMYVKSDESAIALQSYKWGAAQANGMINAGRSWLEVKKQAEILNSKGLRLTNEQEGYRDRLNNYITGIEKGGAYSSIIANTPDGAKAYLDFNRQEAMIQSHVYTGSNEEVANQRNAAHLQNLNQLVTRINAIGIGMDIPDQYRNAIPQQYTQPIINAFQNGQDPSGAINMIAAFDKNNQPYLANAMPDPRKRLTVYEVGNLIGKADAGFLSSYWASQQDGIDYKALQTDKTGKSDKAISDLVNPAITQINGYLTKLPNGVQLASASTDKAVRFVKYQALIHNDPTFSNIDSYIKQYSDHLNRVYQPVSSFSYLIDKNVIPLEKPQMDILAAHALSETYKQMNKYMSREQLAESISRNQPYVISTPTGRIVVVDQYGRAIADKNGHAAYDHFYSEGMLRMAEHDPDADKTLLYNNPFMERTIRPFEFEIELGEKLKRGG